MLTPKIVKAQPLDNFRLRLGFSDGVNGEVDLSHLAGKGVFMLWNDYRNFKKVSVEEGRWLSWADEVEIDADALYMKLTGKTPEDIFPILKEELAHA